MAFTTLPTALQNLITLDSPKSMEETVIEAQYGNGHKQIVPDGINYKKEIWKVTIAPLEGENITTMQTFYDTVDVTKTFWWTPCGKSVPQKGRIVPKTYNEIFAGRVLKQVSFTIEQSFEIET